MAKASEPSINHPHGEGLQRTTLSRRFVRVLEACLTYAGRIVNLHSEYKWRSERYRSRLQLLALNDHELRDIGITREDAVEEANRDFWD